MPPFGSALICTWTWFRSTIKPSRSRWSGPSTRSTIWHGPGAICCIWVTGEPTPMALRRKTGPVRRGRQLHGSRLACELDLSVREAAEERSEHAVLRVGRDRQDNLAQVDMEPEQVQRELIELQRPGLADVLTARGRRQAPGDGDARGEGAFHADCETSVAAVDL